MRETFNQIRNELSLLAGGVREDSFIEPPSQRTLADQTMNLPGVLFAGVPGGSTTRQLFDAL